jgi:hypothetical protein
MISYAKELGVLSLDQFYKPKFFDKIIKKLPGARKAQPIGKPSRHKRRWRSNLKYSGYKTIIAKGNLKL